MDVNLKMNRAHHGVPGSIRPRDLQALGLDIASGFKTDVIK